MNEKGKNSNITIWATRNELTDRAASYSNGCRREHRHGQTFPPDKRTQDGTDPESDEVSGYSCQFGKRRRQRNMVPDVLSAKPGWWGALPVRCPASQKTDCKGKKRMEGNLPNRRNSSDVCRKSGSYSAWHEKPLEGFKQKNKIWLNADWAGEGSG